MSEPTRAWLYRILVTVVPLLIAYGAIDESVAPLWVALAGSVLGLGLATANTSTSIDG